MVVPLAVKEERGVVPPTAPGIVTVPLPFNVNAWAPLIVLEKLIFEPVAMTAPVSVTGPVRPMEELLVVKLPPKLIAVDAV